MEAIDRNIVLTGMVSPEMMEYAIEKINAINEYDSFLELETDGEYVRDYINIQISSSGGSFLDGLAILAAIDGSLTPVRNVTLGESMSMAVALSCAGELRLAHEHTVWMLHSLSAENVSGSLHFHTKNLETLKMFQHNYTSAIVKRSKLTEKEMKKIFNMKDDYFFTSKQALEYGLIDGYITVDENREPYIVWSEEKQKEQEEIKRIVEEQLKQEQESQSEEASE